MRTFISAAVVAAALVLTSLPVARAQSSYRFRSVPGAPPSGQSYEELQALASQALRRNDFTTSIEIHTRMLDVPAPKPQDHCFVYWGLYTAHIFGTGDMPKALRAADDSLRCLEAIPDPEMVEFRDEALRYRSNVMRDWDRYEEALAAQDARQALQPYLAAQFDSGRAIILEMKGDLDGAAAALTRAIGAAEKSADRARWITSRAWIRAKQQRTDQAISDLAEAERLAPRAAGSGFNTYAWMLVEQAKYEEAIAGLKPDERAGSADAASYMYVRGYVEAARGQFGEAAAAFRPAAAQMPGNAGVQVALYLAQARSGQADTSALSALAARMNPEKWPDAQVFYVLGRIDRAQFEAAARFGNPRIERSRLCRMHFVAGEMAIIKRDNAAAKAELSRSLDLCAVEAPAVDRTWARGDLGRL